jgi:hypothetical protein
MNFLVMRSALSWAVPVNKIKYFTVAQRNSDRPKLSDLDSLGSCLFDENMECKYFSRHESSTCVLDANAELLVASVQRTLTTFTVSLRTCVLTQAHILWKRTSGSHGVAENIKYSFLPNVLRRKL